jgi:very-short-patch-repair endonuclease
VLRFWNHEALANTDAMLAAIEQAFHTPTPTLPHQGGGG